MLSGKRRKRSFWRRRLHEALRKATNLLSVIVLYLVIVCNNNSDGNGVIVLVTVAVVVLAAATPMVLVLEIVPVTVLVIVRVAVIVARIGIGIVVLTVWGLRLSSCSGFCGQSPENGFSSQSSRHHSGRRELGGKQESSSS